MIFYGAGGAGPLAKFALAGLWGFLARHFGPAELSSATPLQALLLSLYAIELWQAVLNFVPLGALDADNAHRTVCGR